MKKFLVLGLWAALFLPLGVFGAETATIEQFFESFTLEWYRGDPVSATLAQTFQGAEQDALDRQLTPVTDAYTDQRMALIRRGLSELRQFDRAKLTARERLHAEMLEWQLVDMLSTDAKRDYEFPFDQFGGVQLEMITFLARMHPLRTERDVENYLARLQQVGACMDDACVVARTRAAKGFLPPRFILAATVAQLERFLKPEPAKNLLVTALASRASSIPNLKPEALAAYQTAAEKTVAESVLPAYRRVLALLQELLPKSSDAAGLCRLPGGLEAYAQFLRDRTSTDLTPDQIHELGLRQVARLEAEMDPLLRQLGLTSGTVAERMKQLDQQSFYPDEPGVRSKILADYDAIIRDAEKRCATMFDLRPKAPVTVERESEFAEQNAAANYTPPARDHSLPGVFRVPLPGPRFPRTAEMRSLTYHETVPGHHFQLALQQEMPDLPRFVRDEAFGGGITAFMEGWALYAEYLAKEAGWYEGDVRGELGCLQLQLFRARRLVVDTGLHAKGWTRQQAIDYGFEASEVERYVVLPGQACAYMIGEMKFLELREKARRELGDKFSFKEFHNVVLRTGAVPLPILERVIDDYVRSVQQQNRDRLG